MIKYSCNLLKQESSFTYNLKLCWSNWGKNTFLHLEVIYPLFWTTFNMIISPRWTKVALGHTHTKVNLRYLVSPAKKSKTLIDSFYRYGWSNNPAIWLDGSVFWSITLSWKASFMRTWILGWNLRLVKGSNNLGQKNRKRFHVLP